MSIQGRIDRIKEQSKNMNLSVNYADGSQYFKEKAKIRDLNQLAEFLEHHRKRDNLHVRKTHLAKIHLAKKQLGMDGDDYKKLIMRLTGAQSAGDLVLPERLLLLKELERLGFKPKRRHRNAKPAAKDKKNLTNKIEALLADMKLPWAYADAMAKRMYKVDSVRFCHPDQLVGIISGLTVKQRKLAKKQ